MSVYCVAKTPDDGVNFKGHYTVFFVVNRFVIFVKT